MNSTMCLCAAGAVFAANATFADVEILNFNDSGAKFWWNLNKAVSVPNTSFNLGLLPDLGVTVFDGPVDSEGDPFGPIPPGFIPDGVSMDSSLNPFGLGGPNGRGPDGNGLLAVGPSAGIGNPVNAVAASFVGDSFDLIINDGVTTSLKLEPFVLDDSIDWTVSVYLASNDTTPAAQRTFTSNGLLLGIKTDPFDLIGRVNIFAAGGQAGITGQVETWKPIPGPATLSLVALAGLAAARRRR